jgi:hypothetical protein
VLGYELNESGRAARDARYNTALRTGEYPLITWGWDHTRVQQFLRDTFDVEWIRSACSYCPFALASRAGRAATVARFTAEPEAGVLALVMEYTATALNPTQGLINGARLLTLLRDTAGTSAVLELFERRLAAMPWAVYDLRRALSPRSDAKVNYSRSVHVLDTGTRAAMRAQLNQRARRLGNPITVGDPAFPDDQHPRVWLRRRGPQPPTAEQFLTVAPATAVTKVGPTFPRAWTAAEQLQFTV